MPKASQAVALTTPSPGPSLGFGLGYDTECQIKS